MGNLNNQGLSNITATNNGATVDTNGKIGSCYSFDGNDDYISLVYSDFPTILNDSFTICFWFYNNDCGDRAIFFGNYGLTGSYFNFEKTNAEKVRFYWSSHPDTYTTNLTIPTSVWSHIAVTRDGNNVRFYLNGVLKDTSTTEITGNVPSSANTFYLGRDSRTGATALNGKLNDFRLYDHALSIKEIKEISKGLVCHYALDGNGNVGYNYIKDTNTNNVNINKLFFSEQTGGSTRTIEYDNSIPCIKITRNTTEHSGYAYLQQGSVELNKIEVGKTYTVSFDIIASGEGTIGINGLVKGNATQKMSNSTSVIQGSFNASDWSHVIIRITMKDSFEGITIDNQVVYMYCDYLKGTETWIKVKNFKMEEGTVNNVWCPNPADTLYKIYNIDEDICIDTSGYNHNCLAYQACPDMSPDSPRYNSSCQFDGNISTMCYNNTTDFNLTDEFSWSVWVKPKYTGTSNQYAFTVGRADTGGYGYGLQIVNSTQIRARFGSAMYNITVVDDTWTHIVFTKSGTTIKIYKDGELYTTNTFSGTLPTYSDGSGIGIGCFYYNNTGRIYPYYGKMSDFRLYSTCLSADDIKELYNKPIILTNNGDLMTQGEFVEDYSSSQFYKNGIVKSPKIVEDSLVDVFIQTNPVQQYTPTDINNWTTTYGKWMITDDDLPGDKFRIYLTVQYNGFDTSSTSGTFNIRFQGANFTSPTTSAWSGSNAVTNALNSQYSLKTLVLSGVSGTYTYECTFTLTEDFYNNYYGSNIGLRSDYSNGTAWIKVSDIKIIPEKYLLESNVKTKVGQNYISTKEIIEN